MNRDTVSNQLKKRLTARVGDFEYFQEDLFLFKRGIYGFENLREFVVTAAPHEDIPEIYRYLQSIEEPNLALIMMNALVNSKSSSIIKAEDLEPHLYMRNLKLEDVIVFLVTSIRVEQGQQRVSINTKAPIILAPERQEGWQVILDGSNYQIAHYLI